MSPSWTIEQSFGSTGGSTLRPMGARIARHPIRMEVAFPGNRDLDDLGARARELVAAADLGNGAVGRTCRLERFDVTDLATTDAPIGLPMTGFNAKLMLIRQVGSPWIVNDRFLFPKAA